jgi:23S rRNA (uracil1939-C5)-methyltransferase
VAETGTVVGLSQEGEGIVRGGRAAFVPGALPGETIRFERRRGRRQYDEARLEQIVEPSAERVVPRCAHFAVCGGCALQHLDGAAQLRLKQQQLRESLERIGQVAPARWLEPLASPSFGYRRRARLGVRYVARKGRALVGFRERSSNLIADIARCEVLSPPLDGLIEPLAQLVSALSLRDRLPQIECAVADHAVALVLRVLAPPTGPDLQRLRSFEDEHGVRLYLQSGGIESVRALREPAPALCYTLSDPPLTLEFQPTDFIQVNAAANRALVAAAAELLELDLSSRLLDLYCGLGNFSLALAHRVHAVVGVEGEAALVERAAANAARNGLGNARFYRADLALEDHGPAPWATQSYTHVLLDPPRAGARALLRWIGARAPQRLLYVSCHPGSLARDLGTLVHEQGFELLAAGVVDMFPHTAHVESLALLAPRRVPGTMRTGG